MPRDLARSYVRSRQRRDALVRRFEAVADGVWLGLLDTRALAQIDQAFYATAEEQVEGRSVGYADEAHVRSGLADWERRVIGTWFPPRGRVVVTSAGAGREVLALLELGYDAMGYEPNESFVKAGSAILARLGFDDRLRSSQRDEFPRDAEAADAVVIGWGSYMLVAGRQRRVELLRDARRVLAPGAPLLVSFFVRPSVPYFRIVHVISRAVRRVMRGTPTDFGDGLSPNFVHYFDEAEIRSELAEAGFECVYFAAEPYGHAIGRALTTS